MTVIDQLSLRRDPFGPACAVTGFGVASSLLVARDRLLAAIRRGDPLTVLAGRPGMGKTLLLNMVEQACRADGIEVRTVARGDMAHTALGSGAELLLIDEADTINAATLKALAPGTAEAAAPIMVFAASQPALHRISSDVRTTIVDLRPFDPSEAREFLLTRAIEGGRPELFTPEALDIIVDAGRGSPRLLRVLAGSAMFQAVSDGVARITADHASLAAAMQGSLFGRPPAEPVLPVPANDLGPRVDTEDRPRPLVPPLLRPLSRGRAGALAIAASVALTALVMPVFFLPEPDSGPSMGVPSANAASAVSGAASGPVHAVASAFTVAPANAAVPILPLKASVRTEVALRAASAAAPLAAPRPRIATAGIEARTPSIRTTVASLVIDAVPVTHAVRPDVEMGGGRSLLIDLLAATRPRPAVVGNQSSDGSQGSATAERSAATAQPAPTLIAATSPAIDEPPAGMLAALSPAPVAAPFPGLAVPAAQPTGAKQAADSSRFARAGADEAGAAKQVAAVAKQGAGETRSTKAAAQQAKESARQTQAAKEAADQAKAAKAAADQAAAAKETANQAKAAKDAADQAKSSKEAADQAKAVKAAAEQAKAAKEAADQAKAAKDAADQAKAAKDAADQARAAKDAADQAKAAKEAADQAKAAKDAADQAKAAKDAADQAKAAKDAADQARAAKDAADQAKAAKDAADQAKAAKDAADQAKAARDAASQAKAAKEAADAAKEAAKAAKDAAKAAKEAAKAGKGQ